MYMHDYPEACKNTDVHIGYNSIYAKCMRMCICIYIYILCIIYVTIYCKGIFYKQCVYIYIYYIMMHSKSISII